LQLFCRGLIVHIRERKAVRIPLNRLRVGDEVDLRCPDRH
jgi:hypothetical protein